MPKKERKYVAIVLFILSLKDLVFFKIRHIDYLKYVKHGKSYQYLYSLTA